MTTAPTPPSVFGLDIAVSRDWVADTLGDLNTLYTHHSIVPAFRDGRPVGFKVFSVKPGSPYALLGFQNGDIVERMNGKPIDSPDRALELYQQLQSASTVVLDIRRRGKRVIFRYYIR
ncbi:MAG: PDZ domain-containing protein [Myxococcota bacterium]